MMNTYKAIRLELIKAERIVINIIDSLNESEQDEIYNSDVIPTTESLKFLKNTYYSLNELIAQSNKL